MQPTKSTSRPPNLLGKAAPDPADYCRILASMEHGFVHTAAVAARDHGRGGALALAAVMLLGLLGWLAYHPAGVPASADAPHIAAAPAPLLPAEAPHVPAMAATINDLVVPMPAPIAVPRALAANAEAAAPAYTAKSPRPGAAPETDRDVTLLAALLAHVKGQDD
ncbi:hypothetical protein ACFDR9_000490 [Janthinobacterium sp. CG_23.3]|uniref:hypothetical protein n=1 Tax=Janthinobacterium sp. CG_23.3 TaxID=3349634 RepID=UPI0038D4E1E6